MKIGSVIWVLGFFLGPWNWESSQGRQFRIVHEGLKAFSRGTFEHAGQDIYVSHKGRVQLIRRWDLNSDGYYDLPLASTHNVMVGSIDAIGYLQTGQGFRSVISPMHRSLALYDLWLQEEKSRPSTLRLPGDRPNSIVFSDVDRDGYTDILFASLGLGDTSFADSMVFWGSERGYSRERRIGLATVGATDVVVADLNQDGYQDIVFANRGKTSPRVQAGSYIYWGSTERYGDRHRDIVPTEMAEGCRVADLDGDGHFDLAFATSGEKGGLELYWGSEDGPVLDSPMRIPIAGLTALEIGREGDVEGALAVLSLEDVRLYAFDFRTPHILKEVRWGGNRVRLNDLDGDGRSEIILAADNESTIIWGRDGSTTALPTLEARDVAVADLDENGFLDLVFANYSEGSYGNLDVSSHVYWGSDRGDYGEESRSLLQTFGAASVAVGDLNQDGQLDLLFGNTGSGIRGGKDEYVYVYWGRPHRGYSPAFVSQYPCEMAMGIAMADLDDDNHPELLVANSGRHYSGQPGASYLYWGTVDGPAVEERQDFDLNENGSWEIADLNRDGYLEVIAFDFDTVFIAWGGKEKYSDSNKFVRIQGVATAGQNCRLMDFNQDGWLDLIVADIRGSHSKILLGGADGFSLDRNHHLEEANLGNVEVADLDSDGQLDLVLLRPYTVEHGVDRADSWIKIYHGKSGGVESRARFEFPTAGAIDVVVADLNGDSYLDLGVSQYQSRTHRKLPVLLFWNDGLGGFSAGRRTDLPGESPSGLLAADLDDDGYNDLVVLNHKLSKLEDNHSVDSYLYWGSKDGFSVKERTLLPAPGPHFFQNVDLGNLSTRRLEAHYTSLVMEVPSPVEELFLTYRGETPRGSSIRFLVRSCSTREGLEKTLWQDLTDTNHFMLAKEEHWFQYRAVLVAGRGYASPYLTRVVIEGN